MRDDEIAERIDRLLAGEATAEERAALGAWVGEDPQHARLLDALVEATRLHADPVATQRVDAAWRSLDARNAASPTSTTGSDTHSDPASSVSRLPTTIQRGSGALRPRPKRHSWALARAAALVGLVAGASALAFWRITSDTDADPRATQVAAQTGIGERDTTLLADGTTVILAPGSRLFVSAVVGDGARSVVLEGEAFFRVVPDRTRPFRVNTGSVVTEVLGTAFAVRAYGTGEPVRVAVVEGRVSVGVARARATVGTELNAGDVGTIGDGGVSVARPPGVEPYLGWMAGRVDFDDATLATAAAEIERWFDVDITFADPALAERRVSGRFTTDSIDGVLDAIALALDVHWTRDGRTITIQRPRQS